MKLLRLPQVMDITNLSRSTIYGWVAQGDFPAPIKLGGPTTRAVAWREDEIIKWIESLPTARPTGPARNATH